VGFSASQLVIMSVGTWLLLCNWLICCCQVVADWLTYFFSLLLAGFASWTDFYLVFLSLIPFFYRRHASLPIDIHLFILLFIST